MQINRGKNGARKISATVLAQKKHFLPIAKCIGIGTKKSFGSKMLRNRLVALFMFNLKMLRKQIHVKFAS